MEGDTELRNDSSDGDNSNSPGSNGELGEIRSNAKGNVLHL
jgi:hypothetical protein